MAKNKNADDFKKFARGISETIESLPADGTSVKVEVVDAVTGEEVTSDYIDREIQKGIDEAKEAHPEPIECCTTLHTGRELPQILPREGVDPLLVECYKTFRQILAGGVLNPYDQRMNNHVDVLLSKLKKRVEG